MGYKELGFLGIILFSLYLSYPIWFDYIFTIIPIILVLLFIYWLFYDWKQRTTISLDSRGYERNGYNRLVHRDVAYHYLYREGYQLGKYSQRFGEYDIHHIDRNKRNNSPDNLRILTREEHQAEHGY